MKKKFSGSEFKTQPLESDNMLLIMKESCLKQTGGDVLKNLEILTLSHPRDKRKSMFIVNPNDGSIQEIFKFSQSHRSWFIGNIVESDGKMYISTEIDPLFLVLPYLFEAKMSSTIDQLIHDDSCPDASRLESILDDEQLTLIADKKNCQDLVVWKFNEKKTMSWLEKKVNKVVEVLEQKKLHVGTVSAASNNFIKSVNKKETQENYLRYAHGIVTDYLRPEISEKLLLYLNLPPVEIVSKKRKNTDIDLEEIKKLKKECAEKEIHSKYFLDESKSEKNPRKNVKQAALAKAASGTKSISSFFKKK